MAGSGITSLGKMVWPVAPSRPDNGRLQGAAPKDGQRCILGAASIGNMCIFNHPDLKIVHDTWEIMGVQPGDGKFMAMAILMGKGSSNPSHFTARFMFQADGRRFARHWWQNWSTCSLLKQSFEPPREKRWHHGKPNSSICQLVRWRNAAKTWKCSV